VSKPVVFSIIETPGHPKLSNLYNELGYNELQFSSVRKAISALKKQKPDIIAAEFFYAFSTNYSSNYISNLDSLLITLQKYPDYQPKIIVFVSKREQEYVSKLALRSLPDHVLVQPVTAEQVRPLLVS